MKKTDIEPSAEQKKYVDDCINEEFTKNNFKAQKAIDLVLLDGINTSISFKIDTNLKKVAVLRRNIGYKIDFINFDDIIDCEIIEDSNVVLKGGIGRAVAGGVLAGGVGAIVGATTRKSENTVFNLSIRIITKDVLNPLYNYDLIYNKEIAKSSDFYRQAYEFANNVYSSIIAIKNL